MKANTNKERSFYTQGQQFAARVLCIVWLLASVNSEGILATPKRQPAMTSPSDPFLAGASSTPGGQQEMTRSAEEVPNLMVPRPVIDKEVWERYFGDVGDTPPLPDGIEEILNSPCPFWEGKQVRDTHLLALIPAQVAGQPLTLDYLGELIKSPQGGGYGTAYSYYDDEVRDAIGSQGSGSSYWVLMTRDVLPESRDKRYVEQRALVARHQGYIVPGALEAAVVMLLHHVRSGERLYSDNPWTWTRCRERVKNYNLAVGGFSSEGLIVYDYDSFYGHDHLGIAGLRKF